MILPKSSRSKRQLLISWNNTKFKSKLPLKMKPSLYSKLAQPLKSQLLSMLLDSNQKNNNQSQLLSNKKLIQWLKLAKQFSQLFKLIKMMKPTLKSLNICRLKLPRAMKLPQLLSKIMEKTNKLVFYWRVKISLLNKSNSILTALIMKLLFFKTRPLFMRLSKQQF